MTNEGRLELSPHELRRTARAWLEQERDLLSAAALLGQSDGDLPTPVLAGVHQFFAAWSTAISDRGIETRSIASAVEAVADTAEKADESWGSADRWLWAG